MGKHWLFGLLFAHEWHQYADTPQVLDLVGLETVLAPWRILA
jgi:hypothetical protein